MHGVVRYHICIYGISSNLPKIDNEEIKALKKWKKESIAIWWPILDYVQDKQPLDLKLGESISAWVLNKLKKII